MKRCSRKFLPPRHLHRRAGDLHLYALPINLRGHRGEAQRPACTVLKGLADRTVKPEDPPPGRLSGASIT
jgi:hypothetical protein